MPAAAKIEYAYSFALKVMVTITAITSMLVTYRLGGLVAELFGASTAMGYILRNFFVFLGLGFDLIVMNALGAISLPNSRSKVVWALAIVALLVTLVLSVVSGRFFSEETSGPSHYNVYQAKLLSAMQQDSSMKAEALHIVAASGEEERLRIEQANERAADLLQQAVAKGSAHWQQDYQKAKHNSDAWFWVCTKCDPKYRAYRDGIKAAIDEGNSLKAGATGYSSKIAEMVSPTLSSSVSQDSSILKLEQATHVLEEERKRRAGQLFLILAAFSVGGGLMAILLAVVLKHHRKEHGQFIEEDHIGPILLLFDLFSKARQILLDVIQSVVFRPYQKLVAWNVIQTYSQSNTRWSNVAQENNNQQQNRTNNRQQDNQQSNQQANQQQGQQEREEPTDKQSTGQESANDCKTGACDKRPANRTADKNNRLSAAAKDLITTAERCRIRYKRSFTSKTQKARDNNYAGALEDAEYLRSHGADVHLDPDTMEAHINLQGVQ